MSIYPQMHSKMKPYISCHWTQKNHKMERMTNPINNLLSQLKVSVDDPEFYSRVFTFISRSHKTTRPSDLEKWEKVCCEEYDDLSRRLDATDIQASTSVRNVLKTRKIAILLFTDKGELNDHLLLPLISCLNRSLYSLGPNRQCDAARQEHLLKALALLQESKEMQRFLKNVSKPHANLYADQVIRDTLNLPPNSLITDADAKRAVLSAWLCYLRQNVGSCFATAPAIIIHDEQPEQMLVDMIELLGTGRLKRTFGGIEYSVPISASWGAGDLKKPVILPVGPAATSSNVWLSPGLIAAFEAVDLIQKNDSLKARIEQNKQLVLGVTQEWNDSGNYALGSAEEVIRKVLLKQLNLKRSDLEDYNNRPRNMLQSNLMMQTASLGGGKGQACANFYIRTELAENAFKCIADNALLKTWEFTLASFSETKAQFTRWNLYASLGLESQDPGGIGLALYDVLKQKVEEAKQKIEEFQGEYEIAYQHIKYLEGRLQLASSEKEAHWIKAEYQAKRNEFNMLEEMRNRYHYRAERFANLFNVLVPIYDELFPRYFQEVYDADMHEVSASAYDDSPAGFRLLYKHGRSNTSQWTRIKSPNEFVDALASFFNNTESEVSADKSLAGLENDVSEIITAIVTQIRTQEFIESAFHRMARAHQTPMIKDPLEHLDKIEKKPWAYTSGGTMGTLVSTYYRTENAPTEVGRWVESPTELLVFLIDTVKQIPPKLLEGFDTNLNKSLLIHSPTHAFLLKPGWGLFKQAIESDVFTYTYVRDQFILPAERFIRKIELEESMQEYLIDKIAQKIPLDFQHYFRQVFSYLAGIKDPIEFRQMLVNTVSQERGLRYGNGVVREEEIDSLLWSSLPLFPARELHLRSMEILRLLPGFSPEMLETISTAWDDITLHYSGNAWLDAKILQDTVKAMICLVLEETSTTNDYHWLVSEAARQLGYAMPMPIIFADTNWVTQLFGFLVNPGTGKFELWRTDYTGTVAAPMSSWERWLDGSDRVRTWGVYTRPYEYRR